MRSGLCVHGDGVPADVCGASDYWCTGLYVVVLFVGCLVMAWLVGDFNCVLHGESNIGQASPQRQYNACDNRKKQCGPNETET